MEDYINSIYLGLKEIKESDSHLNEIRLDAIKFTAQTIPRKRALQKLLEEFGLE